MTNQHPITPPPHLIEQWMQDHSTKYGLARKAAQWGANQELEACCEWLVSEGWFKYEHEAVEDLRTARRPKPPSLKDRALQAWAAVEAGTDDQTAMAVIRRALEQLDD
jgi:hypothetical protein